MSKLIPTAMAFFLIAGSVAAITGLWIVFGIAGLCFGLAAVCYGAYALIVMGIQ